MRYLGIDYGRKKVGVAIAYGPLADPYKVIHYHDEVQLLKTLNQIIQTERVDQVIVGLSEQEIAVEATEFAAKLTRESGKPVELADETLTTHDAQARAIEAGMKRSKRRAMEDAMSAAIILQSYLDLEG